MPIRSGGQVRKPTAPPRRTTPSAGRVLLSDLPPVAVPSEPIHRLVLEGAADRGDHPALVDGITGARTSYAELVSMVDRMAAGFAAEGIRPGDVVALHSPNTVLYPVVWHAASRAGATVTSLSTTAPAQDAADQLGDSGAVLVVTVGALLPVALAAAGDRPVWTCDQVMGRRCVTELLDSGGPVPDVPVDAGSDVAALPYTRGSTGLSRGVGLTHAGIGVNLAQVHALHRVAAGDRVLAALPLSTGHGATVAMHLPLRHGATVVVLPDVGPGAFLDVLEQQRITRAYATPSTVRAVAGHPAVPGEDLRALESLLSAAPLDSDLTAAAAARLGCAVGQVYGGADLCLATHLVPDGRAGEFPTAGIGRLVPSAEARLVDPATGADVGDGEPGEIWVRGPQRGVRDPGSREAGTLVDAQGWLHTGDTGTVDAQGWWHLVGSGSGAGSGRGRVREAD